MHKYILFYFLTTDADKESGCVLQDMSHQTELEMRDAYLQASPENYAIGLQDCFYHTSSTSKSALTCQRVYHLRYIYVHFIMIIYQPIGHKNSNGKTIVNLIIFWNTKLLQSVVYHVISGLNFTRTRPIITQIITLPSLIRIFCAWKWPLSGLSK